MMEEEAPIPSSSRLVQYLVLNTSGVIQMNINFDCFTILSWLLSRQVVPFWGKAYGSETLAHQVLLHLFTRIQLATFGMVQLKREKGKKKRAILLFYCCCCCCGRDFFPLFLCRVTSSQDVALIIIKHYVFLSPLRRQRRRRRLIILHEWCRSPLFHILNRLLFSYPVQICDEVFFFSSGLIIKFSGLLFTSQLKVLFPLKNGHLWPNAKLEMIYNRK